MTINKRSRKHRIHRKYQPTPSNTSTDDTFSVPFPSDGGLGGFDWSDGGSSSGGDFGGYGGGGDFGGGGAGGDW